MQARTHWTHSDVWSQGSAMPGRLFTIGDRQNEKTWWNSDQRAICNATSWIDAGRGVTRHQGFSDSSDGARPLRWTQSAWTEISFPDVRQRWVEMASQNQGWIGFAPSPRLPGALKDPTAALAGSVAGYTGPAPMDLSGGKRRISAEERAKWFADGWCVYCSEFNHRTAECAARKKALMFKAAGVEVKDVRNGTGSEESGKD